MGLLDFQMPGLDTPQGQGLLSAAFSLMSAKKMPGQKGAFAGALGDAGQQYLQSSNASQDQMMKRKYLDAQMQAQQMQLEAARRQQAEQERVQAAVRNAFAPMGASQAMAGGGGPTSANAARMGQMPQVDPLQVLRDSGPKAFEEVMRIQGALNPKQKFSTAPQYDQQGRAFILAEDGTVKYLDGIKQRDELISEDLGGTKGFRTKYSPDMVGSVDKTMTFGDKIAQGQLGVSQANLGLAQQRLSMDKATNAGGAKAPTGYRFKPDGSLEAIPGGPADIKAGELGAKAEARRQSQQAQAASVLETIGEAKGLVGNTTAGFGAFAANMPATDARNLAAKLETIKANLGFDRLQQMREQSPTGGALGAVAVQELTALQSTVSSLDQKQSPAQLRASLAKIEKHYKRWQETVQSANQSDKPSGGATGSWGGNVVDFGSLK